MVLYLRFVWDCGVCSLSCGECPLNSEKATAMIGCFNTRYFAFNFNRHLPHVQVVTRDCGLRRQLPSIIGSAMGALDNGLS